MTAWPMESIAVHWLPAGQATSDRGLPLLPMVSNAIGPDHENESALATPDEDVTAAITASVTNL